MWTPLWHWVFWLARALRFQIAWTLWAFETIALFGETTDLIYSRSLGCSEPSIDAFSEHFGHLEMWCWNVEMWCTSWCFAANVLILDLHGLTGALCHKTCFTMLNLNTLFTNSWKQPRLFREFGSSWLCVYYPWSFSFCRNDPNLKRDLLVCVGWTGPSCLNTLMFLSHLRHGFKTLS
jgi:hypothetical protein